MNDWHNFLRNQGATLQDGVVQSFGRQNSEASLHTPPTQLFDLSHLGILRIAGDGASQLLQGQTTCDFRELDQRHSLIGAQCDPRGRVIATFRAYKTAESEVALLLPADQIQAVKEALGKYAPFFKVSLENDHSNTRILGLAGPQAGQVCRDVFPDAELAVNEVRANHNGTLMCLSDNRYLIFTPDQSAQSLWLELAARANPAGTPLWTLLDIGNGIGDVVAATREMFIPQMINLQILGAISFKKGCYTGQEVVARMHYRGKTKRQMYRIQAVCNDIPAPGTPCYTADNPQSIGNVVIAAHAHNHSLDNPEIELLAVLTQEAATSEQLRFGDTEPVATKLLSLPYSLDIP